MSDRQQRRQRKRQLQQLGETVMKRGLPQTPPPEPMLGLAVVLRDTLADTSVADRASRAAAIVHKVFELSAKATPSKLDIACRKGCSYCCYTQVSATAPELFLIARTLETAKPGKAPPRDAVLAGAARTAGLGVEGRFGKKIPCALLAENACSMYAERPTVCRQVTSTNLAACLDEYEGRDFNGDMVVSRLYLDHARNCRIPLQAALISLDLPLASYELGAGLTAALETGAEEAWLSGRDTFQGVAPGPAEPAPIQQAIRMLATALVAL